MKQATMKQKASRKSTLYHTSLLRADPILFATSYKHTTTCRCHERRTALIIDTTTTSTNVQDMRNSHSSTIDPHRLHVGLHNGIIIRCGTSPPRPILLGYGLHKIFLHVSTRDPVENGQDGSPKLCEGSLDAVGLKDAVRCRFVGSLGLIERIGSLK